MNTFKPQSSYSYEEIIECGKGNLFGEGNAQLPAPPMLMFDRSTNVNKDGVAIFIDISDAIKHKHRRLSLIHI